MAKRRTKFVDLPVHISTREKIRRKKGKKSYDNFLSDILDSELGL
jgi:hypothetical protein|tara:strand:- start:376 stop:510 length:135 start_codon:yes stop_codon:yes gene_type:complete